MRITKENLDALTNLPISDQLTIEEDINEAISNRIKVFKKLRR